MRDQGDSPGPAEASRQSQPAGDDRSQPVSADDHTRAYVARRRAHRHAYPPPTADRFAKQIGALRAFDDARAGAASAFDEDRVENLPTNRKTPVGIALAPVLGQEISRHMRHD